MQIYRTISNISHTKIQNLNDSRLVWQVPLPNPLKSSVKWKNEYVVGAAPTGDTPITSEWSSLLPANVRPILEVYDIYFLWK